MKHKRARNQAAKPRDEEVILSLSDHFNKLTSVFHASVLLLIMNFVITLSKYLWMHEAIADYFDNAMKKFIVNNRSDALKTDIKLFVYDKLSNCPLSFVDASHKL